MAPPTLFCRRRTRRWRTAFLLSAAPVRRADGCAPRGGIFALAISLLRPSALSYAARHRSCRCRRARLSSCPPAYRCRYSLIGRGAGCSRGGWGGRRKRRGWRGGRGQSGRSRSGLRRARCWAALVRAWGGAPEPQPVVSDDPAATAAALVRAALGQGGLEGVAVAEAKAAPPPRRCGFLLPPAGARGRRARLESARALAFSRHLLWPRGLASGRSGSIASL